MTNNNTVKIDLVTVNTQKSEKSIKSLKSQIKDLRLQLEQLEEGTAEYNEVLAKCSELQHQQTEIVENIKLANTDYGNTLQVVQKATTGLIASYTAVTSTMNLLGIQSEDTTESLLKVQSGMALLTALSQLDEFEKSMKELFKRITNVVTARNIEQKEIKESTQDTIKNTVANNANANSIKSQNTALTGGVRAINIFKGGLKSLAASLKSFAMSNPFTLILAGITACITAISHFKKKAEEAKIKASELANDNITKLLRQTKQPNNVDLSDKNLTTTYSEASNMYNNIRKTLDEYKEKYKFFKSTKEEIEALNKEFLDYQKQSNEVVDKWNKMSRDERESAEGLATALDMYHKLILTYNREAIYLEEVLQSLHDELLITDEDSKLYQSKLDSYNKKLDELAENEEKFKNVIKANDDIRNKIYAHNEKITADEKEKQDKALEEQKSRWDKELAGLKDKLSTEQERISLAYNKREVTEEEYYKKSLALYEQYENDLIKLQNDGNPNVKDIDTLTAQNTTLEAKKRLSEYQIKLIQEREILSEQIDIMVIDEKKRLENDIQSLNNTISDNFVKVLSLRNMSLREQYEAMKKYDTLTEEEQVEHLDRMLDTQISYLNDEMNVLEHNYDREQKILEETYKRDEEVLRQQLKENIISQMDFDKEYADLKRQYITSLTDLDNEYKLNKINIEYDITQAEAEYSNQRYEIMKNEIQRKIDLQNMWYEAVSTTYGEFSVLLGTIQSMYDENSETYKNIARVQIVSDTISASVSAYRSGISSGLPAPANLIYGGVLASITTANGLLQLKNLEAERISNTSTTSAVNNVGSTYETLAYASSLNDINNNIRDSKVYVLESEIQEVSNRVHIYENESRF